MPPVTRNSFLDFFQGLTPEEEEEERIRRELRAALYDENQEGPSEGSSLEERIGRQTVPLPEEISEEFMTPRERVLYSQDLQAAINQYLDTQAFNRPGKRVEMKAPYEPPPPQLIPPHPPGGSYRRTSPFDQVKSGPFYQTPQK